MIEKLVIVTKKTTLEELIERFNTRDQARFYIEHMGGSFSEYQEAHDAYQRSLARLKAALPREVRTQFIERSFLPSFSFGENDLVVTAGPDGLVVNTAKYLSAQPLLALNPDPQRIDGILVPFRIEQCHEALRDAVHGRVKMTKVAMARASLNDTQTLYAVNDLFIGQASHVSARYRLAFGGRAEDQSSSGIIVSTGAGSTGWLRSVLTGASRVVQTLGQITGDGAAPPTTHEMYRFAWDAEQLIFSVREPFVSKVSGAELVFGRVDAGHPLTINSKMPQNGVIFSDGIEEDYLEFNSGTTATITLAEKKLHLITG